MLENLYEELVERLLKDGSAEVISNGQREHAAALFKVFLRNANSDVRIFCYDLNKAVFDDAAVLREAADAVKRGVCLQIVMQSTPLPDSKFVAWAEKSRSAGGSVTLKQCKPGSPAAALRDNFATMDRKAFRYEPNRTELKANACMNQPEITGEFVSLFEKVAEFTE